MTTFTTEDRLIAEKDGSVTINVEPIPFAGLITITESAPKYRELTDVEISLIAEEFTGADGLDVVDFGRAILRKAQE
jgi:hypothetical protein